MRPNNYGIRKLKILDMLKNQGVASVSSIIKSMEVSSETVRKDLISLEQEGLINRYHGSIVLVSNETVDLEKSLHERKNIFTATKQRLAEEVYKHLPQDRHAVLGLDVGNTVWHLAKLLKERDRRIIVTNSQEIAELYADQINSELYCTGGLLRSFDKGYYGPWTVKSINSTSMTAVVLSSAGVKNRQGLGGVSFEDGDVKRAYVKNSAYVIAMLDSSKFCHCTLVDAVSWQDVDLLVTDTGISEADFERLSKLTKIITVEKCNA